MRFCAFCGDEIEFGGTRVGEHLYHSYCAEEAERSEDAAMDDLYDDDIYERDDYNGIPVDFGD